MEEDFNKAVERSNELTVRPSNEELLKLYGLYKQSTVGDIVGERPGGFDFKGAAKHDAWSALKGMEKQVAMQAYIDLVDTLHQREK